MNTDWGYKWRWAQIQILIQSGIVLISIPFTLSPPKIWILKIGLKVAIVWINDSSF